MTGYSCYSVYTSCVQISLLVGQSIVLGYLSDYFVLDSPSTTDTRNAYLYATGMVIVPFGTMFFATYQFHNAVMSGMTVRLIASSAIYQKVGLNKCHTKTYPYPYPLSLSTSTHVLCLSIRCSL